MRTNKSSKSKMAFLLVVLLVTMITLPAYGQPKLQASPGGYHGELDFPISWKQYYSYVEWTKIVHYI